MTTEQSRIGGRMISLSQIFKSTADVWRKVG